MARYTLILNDEVYHRLYERAVEEKISLGKLLNRICCIYADKGVLKEVKEVKVEVPVLVFECPFCYSKFDGAAAAREHIKVCSGAVKA